MGFVQKDALRTMILSYAGLTLGYLNKGVLFLIFLTTDEIGLINLILTLGFLFAQFSNLGSIYATWKYFPFFRNEEKKNYGFLLLTTLIVLAGSLIFTVLAIVLKDQISAYYSVKSQLFVDYYYWIIPVGIANVFFLLFENYLRGLYKNLISVLSYEVILRGFTLVAILLYGFKWIHFQVFLLITCMLYFVPTIILFIYLIKIKELHFSISSITVPKRFRRIVINFSMLSYVNTLGTLIVASLDALMIAAFLGLSATGVYTTIIFLASALQVPFRSLTRITGPLVALYWKEKNMVKMDELYKKSSSALLVISLYLFMLIWINRIEIFSTLRPEFMEGIPVFLFIMIGRITDMYFGINGNIFITSKKYRYDLLFTLALLVIVYSLNYWLIPIYGITGAAISTGLAYVFYNFGRLAFIYFAYDLHPFTKSQMKVLVLFALNVVLFELMPTVFSHKFLEIIFNSALFSATFILVIYALNLEPEIKNYIKKGLSFVQAKVFKKQVF
ncbi:MAG: polysaccharide biosynthesis C-terminal domain-containing protein [Crocinitomicaceae bacterium]|nr:polysaccharide biosynthesis C-terminal domain-containing protein [Crocinitomicaceae bacterium]